MKIRTLRAAGATVRQSQQTGSPEINRHTHTEQLFASAFSRPVNCGRSLSAVTQTDAVLGLHAVTAPFYTSCTRD